MTAEELIIGHYERTLTSEQESRLASMVASSPDVRTLYEQHGNIQTMMVEEAESIETSSKLDKIVLGAALGTLAEIAGQGIGFSLLGKVATVVGTLAVGGAGFVLYNSMSGDDVPQKGNPPAVRSAPTTAPVSPVPSTETRSEAPATDARESEIARETQSTPAATTDARSARTTSPADGRSQTNRDRTRSGAGTNGSDSGTQLRLDGDSADVTIQHDPKTVPQDTGKGK